MKSVLHAIDIWSGNTTDTTRVLAPMVHNYRSDRWIALKIFSAEFPEAVLHRLAGNRYSTPTMFGHALPSTRPEYRPKRSSGESVLHANDVRSGNNTDTTRVRAHKVHNYRSDRWIALKFFSRVSGGCFTWSSMKMILLTDDVRSGNNTDTTRVPAQKVYNYISDHCITLKICSGVSRGSFTWSSVELVLHADDVRSGHTTDTTRVTALKDHNYRFDRWIALKFHSRVSIGRFTISSVHSVLHSNNVWSGHSSNTTRGVTWNRYSTPTMSAFFTRSCGETVLQADNVRSGNNTNTTRVPAQKVHNYRHDSWNTLKIFSGVSRGYFTWSNVKSILHADDVRSGRTAVTTAIPVQKVHNYRSNRRIALKSFSGVSGGSFTWTRMKSVFHADDIRVKSILHADDVRSGNNTDMTREFPEAVLHGVARNRYSMPTTSGHALPPTRPGNRPKRSSRESILHADDVQSGNNTDTTRLRDKKVHNYRSDRWIALKFFSEVSRGCFTYSSVKLILLADDVRSGNNTDTTKVQAQKVHNYRSDRCFALKICSGVSRGSFTWSSVESVLHGDDVRSGHTIDMTREFLEAVLLGVAWNQFSTPTTSGRAVPPSRLEYRRKRSISEDRTTFVRAIPPSRLEYQRKRSISKDLTVADNVRSGNNTNMTRVPAQNVHNYRYDRWIALNVKSILHADDFRSGRIAVTTIVPAQKEFLEAVLHGVGEIGFPRRRHPVGTTTDTTRVPAQNVYNYRYDRVSGGCFTWSSVKSILHSNDIRSGNNTDITRVQAQKVHNYRFDRWIALKYFSRVSGGCFIWSSEESEAIDSTTSGHALPPTRLEYRPKRSSGESILHADDVWSGNNTDTTRVRAQKVHNYRSNRWIALKIFSGVFEGCFRCSNVKLILLADDVRSGDNTDTTRAVLHGVASNRFSMPTISNRVVPPSRLEYQRKSSGESVLRADDVWSGNNTDTTRVQAQKVHNYRFDRGIALKYFLGVLEAILHGVECNRFSTPMMSGRAVPPSRLEFQLKRSITKDPTIGEDPMSIEAAAADIPSTQPPDCNLYTALIALLPLLPFDDCLSCLVGIPTGSRLLDCGKLPVQLLLFVPDWCLTLCGLPLVVATLPLLLESSGESVLHVDDVRSGTTTNTTRVLAQKVHNYRSDRWIALKFFLGVSRGCFTWSSVE
ncbi:hypothetical protein NC652_024769 [Populus alba x Populus x berolinensis]|nr:hypothetical protein NC652_024769 [Populus alba x Populus x berolinensis]